MFLLLQKNLQRKETKWFYFVRSQLTSSKQSRTKKQDMNIFSFIGLIPPIKNIKQNIGENIVHCWFYKTSIKILQLISKATPPLLLICRQNSNIDFVKQILYKLYTIQLFDSAAKFFV
jgi:hypothetical protein